MESDYNENVTYTYFFALMKVILSQKLLIGLVGPISVLGHLSLIVSLG